MRLPGDKLISSVLVQFLLSPLILITGDGINENVNNGSACNANNSCLQASCWPCHASTIEHPMSTASVSFNVTNPNLMQTGSRTKQEIDGKFNSHHATIVTPHETHDPSSALRKNASTHHQTPMKKRANQVDIHANVTSTVANDGSKILSRKRRYLIFPPGSSMQIVHDEYHSIVEKENYLVMGITAAMAWELPSKPTYFDEGFNGNYQAEKVEKVEKASTLNRNDKNVTQADYAPPVKSTSNYYYTNVPKVEHPAKSPLTKAEYLSNFQYPWKSGNPSQYQYPSKYGSSAPPVNRLENYVSYADNVMKQLQQLANQIPQNRPLNTDYLKELSKTLQKSQHKAENIKPKDRTKKNYSHFIRPVFRKRRSIDNDWNALEKIDLKLHRTTRHALYRQIDTFLKAQGSNGNDCIRKTMCETGQRTGDAEPGPMVIELLRTIFTLPEAVDNGPIHPLHEGYDAAYRATGNCEQLYPMCKESVWNTKLMTH